MSFEFGCRIFVARGLLGGSLQVNGSYQSLEPDCCIFVALGSSMAAYELLHFRRVSAPQWLQVDGSLHMLEVYRRKTNAFMFHIAWTRSAHAAGAEPPCCSVCCSRKLASNSTCRVEG